MTKATLIEDILNMEWEMFAQVRSSTPAPCQGAPDRFRAIRRSEFDVWTVEMLVAYLEQLRDAKARGRNLMTEKYARMDNLIPPLSDNPLIDEIVTISERWQSELRQRYPVLYRICCRDTIPTGDGSDFSVYLRSELEIYGERTLILYHRNVKIADGRERNLSILALKRLVQRSGYGDLDEAERILGRMDR